MKALKIPIILLLLFALIELIFVPMSANAFPAWAINIYTVFALIILIFFVALY